MTHPFMSFTNCIVLKKNVIEKNYNVKQRMFLISIKSRLESMNKPT